MGMLTSPKVIDPFHSARAMLLVPFELAFSFQPILEVHPVAAAALQIALISALPNVLFPRLRVRRLCRLRTGFNHRFFARRVIRRLARRLAACREGVGVRRLACAPRTAGSLCRLSWRRGCRAVAGFGSFGSFRHGAFL